MSEVGQRNTARERISGAGDTKGPTFEIKLAAETKIRHLGDAPRLVGCHHPGA